jgi:NAD(P)-dependent dehydrogenase (short-subunit alcohol dehydrogenase family)
MSGNRPLQDRVVVVTGATAGVGRATALRLASQGATVVACARSAGPLAELAALSPHIVARRCDVSDDQDRAELIATAVAEHGRLDALVNNVGIGWTGLVEDMTVDQIRRLFEVNVVGLIDLTRLALPHLLARGDGDIVIVASGASWFATPPLTVYSATKYAVTGFAEGLRREIGTRGVRVHTVHPGLVSTQFSARSVGTRPGEVAGPPSPGPGFSPEWVAAAIERSLTRRGRGGAVAVPRLLGLTRVVKLPGLRHAVDLVVGANAERISRLSRRIAEQDAAGVR